MNSECRIVEMGLSHVGAVVDVEEQCFSIPWSRSDFIKEITVNTFAYYYVAMLNNEVVGYAGIWHIITEGHITNIAVLPSYRKLGIGNLLLNKLLEFAKEKEMIGVTLEVRISNEPAQRLYTKNGFKIEGFRKKYYADTGEDAVIMWRYF